MVKFKLIAIESLIFNRAQVISESSCIDTRFVRLYAIKHTTDIGINYKFSQPTNLYT